MDIMPLGTDNYPHRELLTQTMTHRIFIYPDIYPHAQLPNRTITYIFNIFFSFFNIAVILQKYYVYHKSTVICMDEL